MLKLNNTLTLDKAAILSPNLCDKFDDDDLKRIGEECWDGYDRDQQSRQTWMKRNEAGMDLALQIQKDKSFPWPGCSNVAFPLVTIAAMQFHARAYPAIVNGTDVVKVVTFGEDSDEGMASRADRISTHMSWQLLYQDKDWEDQEDKSIFNVSIVGCNFKKSYFSASQRYNKSELVLAKDLVLDYWSKSVESSPRKTHKLPTYRNEVYENVMRGKWRDILEDAWYKGMPPVTTSIAQINQNNRQGVQPPPPDHTSSFMFLEQHCSLDLDDDGYAEPYIITFEESSKTVVRIVTRFDNEDAIERVAVGPNRGKIIQITPIEYFTKREFIPSPDGGIYGIGFGVFLGPLNESVNSLVNMLLDAGTMQTTAGGFLARGAKIRGGTYNVSPFEWKRVDSTGDDLRKSIFPLPVNAPSDVLFQLLALLINYTNRISGTTDMMVGENPGQNTPAETARTMVEMGHKIYSAIFKRLWRSIKEELQKLYRLNGMYLEPGKVYPGGATLEDYMGNGEDICPVADPNITSDVAKLQQATAVKASAMTTSGYNKDEVEIRYLKALHVDDVKRVFPGTQGQPPAKDPKLQIQEIKEQGSSQRVQMQLSAAREQFMIELLEEQRLNNAKIVELEARARESGANAQSEMAYAQVALVNAEISKAKTDSDRINQQINHLLDAAKLEIQRDAIDKKEAA